MPEILLDGRGTGDTVGVTSGNRLMTDSVINETSPTDGTKNNPAWQFDYIVSGIVTGITTGSAIGSIVQTIGAGSFVQVITYTNNNIVSIGSWS